MPKRTNGHPRISTEPTTPTFCRVFADGASRDRTGDLLLANAELDLVSIVAHDSCPARYCSSLFSNGTVKTAESTGTSPVPPAGFEPAISCVKGRRPRPLDHGGGATDCRCAHLVRRSARQYVAIRPALHRPAPWYVRPAPKRKRRSALGVLGRGAPALFDIPCSSLARRPISSRKVVYSRLSESRATYRVLPSRVSNARTSSSVATTSISTGLTPAR
jgi:hypothetical protein